MNLRGRFANDQCSRNLFVRKPLGKQLKDFCLSRRELRGWVMGRGARSPRSARYQLIRYLRDKAGQNAPAFWSDVVDQARETTRGGYEVIESVSSYCLSNGLVDSSRGGLVIRSACCDCQCKGAEDGYLKGSGDCHRTTSFSCGRRAFASASTYERPSRTYFSASSLGRLDGRAIASRRHCFV